MKKFFLSLILVSSFGFSQEEKYSETSVFINNSSHIKIISDEKSSAVFKSGMGESVSFFPSNITDLKTNKTIKGLQIESNFIIGQKGLATVNASETAWVSLVEVPDLLFWFENYIIPNINLQTDKKQNIKYIYNSKEVTIKFEIINKIQNFSVILRNSPHLNKYFWTEAKVNEIPKVVSTLKSLINQ